MKIYFITDGGLQLGMGHVQQATTLAKELRSRAEVSFLTKSGEVVLAKIGQAGFPARHLPGDGAILEQLRTERPDVIIFDKIDVAEDLAREIKATLDAGLVIFTNLTAANRHADVAITADIGSKFRNVKYIDDETGTLYLFGPKYWVLRREFHEFHARVKKPVQHIRRILLLFGGSDPANLGCAVVDELLASAEPLEIDLILGAHFGHEEALARVLVRHPRRDHVQVHRNIGEVAELMFRADLVIASPGLSVFEALRVGTPVIVIPQDELQRDTYHGFMRLLERHEVGKLRDMIARRDFTYPADPEIAAMEIGEGLEEILSEIARVGAIA